MGCAEYEGGEVKHKQIRERIFLKFERVATLFS